MEAAEATEAVLARFGDLAEAIGAAEATLAAIPALGAEGAAALKAIEAALRRVESLRAARRPVLACRRAVLDYLGKRGAEQAEGECRALFLDPRSRLLADEIIGTVPARDPGLLPARVLRRAVVLDAAAIVLARRAAQAHPMPEAGERALAQRMAEAAGLIGMGLRDYLLLGRRSSVSVLEVAAG